MPIYKPELDNSKSVNNFSFLKRKMPKKEFGTANMDRMKKMDPMSMMRKSEMKRKTMFGGMKNAMSKTGGALKNAVNGAKAFGKSVKQGAKDGVEVGGAAGVVGGASAGGVQFFKDKKRAAKKAIKTY